jgi:hypothetical protein
MKSPAQSHPHLSLHVHHPLVGSWLVTYDVQAFGVLMPLLLSCGHNGVMIETESPAPTPVGNLGILMLSNGHGAWESTRAGEFAYLYRKLIYQQAGFTPFGTTRMSATGSTSADGMHQVIPKLVTLGAEVGGGSIDRFQEHQQITC